MSAAAAPRLPVARVPGADPAVPLPVYATGGAAGMDLCANLPVEARASGVALAPGARAAVPTGLCMAVPDGWELQLRARSGLALRQGLMLVNAPGTVDSDYRGEVKVIVMNAGDAPITLRHGERIAQAVLAAAPQAVIEEVDALPPTARGAGGFGSTGV